MRFEAYIAKLIKDRAAFSYGFKKRIINGAGPVFFVARNSMITRHYVRLFGMEENRIIYLEDPRQLSGYKFVNLVILPDSHEKTKLPQIIDGLLALKAGDAKVYDFSVEFFAFIQLRQMHDKTCDPVFRKSLLS